MSGLVAWMVIATLVGVLVGRGIGLADAAESRPHADLAAPGGWAARSSRPGATRRGVPLPAWGVALALAAVLLQTTGYVLRLTGETGQVARLLSMDAPYSLPRIYAAALFTAAALMAAAGAGRIAGRRTWWMAVALVSAGIATVKVGGTVHYRVMDELELIIGGAATIAVSVLVAAGLIAVLAYLSRAERRDRRRVLTCLTAYAGASVGLSAVSSVIGDLVGVANTWYFAATFVEEAGESLAAVGLLTAVVLGVAPTLVLPASSLRRRTDAETLEVPAPRPGFTPR